MQKLYIIGEKDGKRFVAHTANINALDYALEITKAEYRRHRESGIPSLGEYQTEAKRSAAQKFERAARWDFRNRKARLEDRKIRSDWARKCAAERVRLAEQGRQERKAAQA